MKMLVTSAGWLASRLVKYFYKDYDITILTRDEAKKTKLQQNWKKLSFIFHDLRDPLNVNEHFDVVIHAAALKHITTSYLNKEIVYACNVTGTKNILEWCFEYNRKSRFIFISTDKVVFPRNYYGWTKLQGEKLCKFYSRAYGLNTCRVRFGNLWASEGSLLQILFKKQFWGEKDFEISHPESERFFLTWQEAAELIKTAINTNKELVIGKYKSARIIDIFSAMFGNVDLKIVGLRPGEKIKEEIGIDNYEKKYYTVDELKELFDKIREEEMGDMLS